MDRYKCLYIQGPKIFSPCWTVLFYLSSILMSLGQQLALVHTVISGILAIRPKYLRQFETFITFLTCLLGYVLTFPMATEVSLDSSGKNLQTKNFTFTLVELIYCLLFGLHNWMWLVGDDLIFFHVLCYFDNKWKIIFSRKLCKVS